MNFQERSPAWNPHLTDSSTPSLPEVSRLRLRIPARCLQLVCFALTHAAWSSTALAHNPDTSYLDLKVTEDAIETRLSYDIITLLAIVPGLDADGDKAVSKVELAAADPAIRKYLAEKVTMEIDGKSAGFGDALPFIWPEEMPDPIPQVDYHQVVFHFPWKFERAPPDDIAIVFDLFREFGERHKVLSQLQYLDFKEEILFRLEEPDYLLDLAYIRAQQAANATEAETVRDGKNDETKAKKDEPYRTNLWVILVVVLLPVWILLMSKAKKGMKYDDLNK